MALISVEHLQKRFNLEAGFFARFGRFVYAVNDVSFSIGRNEAYGLVGESGCGKTTTARLLVRMYEADGGKIIYTREGNPVDISTLKRNDLKQYRRKVKYVFQDPARSLNPRMSISDILLSGAGAKTGQLREKAAAALEEVGLSADDLDRRPTEFSGGQRQRISIARGLLPQPDLLICDEVVSALDVSIQGQILNLLLDIRNKRKMSFLFIAHDLKVACYFCDRSGVIYSGRLCEEAPADKLWNNYRHPYTAMLFACAAGTGSNPDVADLKRRKPNVDTSVTAATLAIDTYCSFAPRCPMADKRCFSEKPVMEEAESGHFVSCHHYAAFSPAGRP